MASSADDGAEPIRASVVLGNVADGDWPGRLHGSRVDVLTLDAAEAQRNRFRKRTAGGIDVAIALDRGVQLQNGDVLHWDGRTAVVAQVDLGDVLVVDLSALLDEPAETLLSRCVQVGHALGNQHWPAVVKASQVYVPQTVAQHAMEVVMETHQLENVSWWFARGADVLPYLEPDEARLLFAGAAGHAHSSAGRSQEEVQ